MRRGLLAVLTCGSRRTAIDDSEEGDQPESVIACLGFRQLHTPWMASVYWVLSLVAATVTVISAVIWAIMLATATPSLTVDALAGGSKSATIIACNNGPVDASKVVVTVIVPREVQIDHSPEESAAIQSAVLLNGGTRLCWNVGRLNDGDTRGLRLTFSESVADTLDVSCECRAALSPTTVWTIAGLLAAVPLILMAILLTRLLLEAAVILHQIEYRLGRECRPEQDR